MLAQIATLIGVDLCAGIIEAAKKSTSCDNDEVKSFHKGGFNGFERSRLWDRSPIGIDTG
jgi:hypothetical protein